MKTLTRYIGREVLYATLLIFVALLMLFAFFDLIHELANVGKDGYPLGRALLFVGLSVPGHVYELVPTAALIGTLFAISSSWRIRNTPSSVLLALRSPRSRWPSSAWASPWRSQHFLLASILRRQPSG